MRGENENDVCSSSVEGFASCTYWRESDQKFEGTR